VRARGECFTHLALARRFRIEGKRVSKEGDEM